VLDIKTAVSTRAREIQVVLSCARERIPLQMKIYGTVGALFLGALGVHAKACMAFMLAQKQLKNGLPR